jgi:hypothetical protein
VLVVAEELDQVGLEVPVRLGHPAGSPSLVCAPVGTDVAEHSRDAERGVSTSLMSVFESLKRVASSGATRFNDSKTDR